MQIAASSMRKAVALHKGHPSKLPVCVKLSHVPLEFFNLKGLSNIAKWYGYSAICRHSNVFGAEVELCQSLRRN